MMKNTLKDGFKKLAIPVLVGFGLLISNEIISATEPTKIEELQKKSKEKTGNIINILEYNNQSPKDSLSYIQSELKTIAQYYKNKGIKRGVELFGNKIEVLYKQYVKTYKELEKDSTENHDPSIEKIQDLFRKVGIFFNPKVIGLETDQDSIEYITTDKYEKKTNMYNRIKQLASTEELKIYGLTIEKIEEIILYQEEKEVQIAAFHMIGITDPIIRENNLEQLGAYYKIMQLEKDEKEACIKIMKPIQFEPKTLKIAKEERVGELAEILSTKIKQLNSGESAKNGPYRLEVEGRTPGISYESIKKFLSGDQRKYIEKGIENKTITKREGKELGEIFFTEKRAEVLKEAIKKELDKSNIDISSSAVGKGKGKGTSASACINIYDRFNNLIMSVQPESTNLSKVPLTVPENSKFVAERWQTKKEENVDDNKDPKTEELHKKFVEETNNIYEDIVGEAGKIKVNNTGREKRKVVKIDDESVEKIKGKKGKLRINISRGSGGQDVDLSLTTPERETCSYVRKDIGNRKLDIDANFPGYSSDAQENIYTDQEKMTPGRYEIRVRYSNPTHFNKNQYNEPVPFRITLQKEDIIMENNFEVGRGRRGQKQIIFSVDEENVITIL